MSTTPANPLTWSRSGCVRTTASIFEMPIDQSAGPIQRRSGTVESREPQSTSTTEPSGNSAATAAPRRTSIMVNRTHASGGGVRPGIATTATNAGTTKSGLRHDKAAANAAATTTHAIAGGAAK